MLSSSGATIGSGSRAHSTFSVGNHISSRLNVGQPNIELVMDDSDGPRRIVPSYSTMDTISGHVSITAPFDSRFEDIDIAFIGTSHTLVNRVTESTHRFLTLRQPTNLSKFPLPRILEAGKTYRFPFNFNIPAQLLPEACTHDVVADYVCNTHLMLPPSLGDPDLSGFGSALLDDLAPEMSKIRYGVKVRILEQGVVDNVIRVLGEQLKKVRVKPVFEEQAPLNIDNNKEFRPKQEKIIKKGLFKGKLGTLTAQTLQPRPFKIPGARTSDNAPITTVAKLVLRFDPADKGARPPALSSLHAKLTSSTFYASSPRHNLPSRTDMSQGVYDEDVELNSLCIATAKWEEHTEASDPALESYISGPFYTAQILVPVILTDKKSFIPTFHSCLISRTYTLCLQFAPHGGPKFSLKVPVQVCANGSNTGIENVRARSVEAVVYREAADVFTPRSTAPNSFDGLRGGVQARDELLPDYAALSPSTRAPAASVAPGGKELVLEEVRVNPVPIKRTLLFRAHRHTARDQPGAYNARTQDVVFDDHYWQAKSVNDFVLSLGNHLGKTKRQTKTGRRLRTKFTSTSSRLNRTLHLTGKKSREQHEQGETGYVSFVIFDLQVLSETPNVAVFRVADVLDFLQTSEKSSLIPEEYQRWARNCDEYVIMGRGVENAVLQTVPWSELRVTPILNQHFHSAYTLKLNERFRDNAVDRRIETGFEQVCKMVVESAKAVAGHKANDAALVQLLVLLILKPGTWFWGINTSSGQEEIRDGCKTVIEDELVLRMSQVSVD